MIGTLGSQTCFNIDRVCVLKVYGCMHVEGRTSAPFAFPYCDFLVLVKGFRFSQEIVAYIYIYLCFTHT